MKWDGLQMEQKGKESESSFLWIWNVFSAPKRVEEFSFCWSLKLWGPIQNSPDPHWLPSYSLSGSIELWCHCQMLLWWREAGFKTIRPRDRECCPAKMLISPSSWCLSMEESTLEHQLHSKAPIYEHSACYPSMGHFRHRAQIGLVILWLDLMLWMRHSTTKPNSYLPFTKQITKLLVYSFFKEVCIENIVHWTGWQRANLNLHIIGIEARKVLYNQGFLFFSSSCSHVFNSSLTLI